MPAGGTIGGVDGEQERLMVTVLSRGEVDGDVEKVTIPEVRKTGAAGSGDRVEKVRWVSGYGWRRDRRRSRRW